MNLANKLTLSRILVIPLFLVFLAPESFSFAIPEPAWPVFRLFALLIFIGASITDYYDGVLARRHGWITNFGKLMDPLADKILVMAAFVVMVQLETFPAWMVALVLAREFMITGLRQLGLNQGRVLAADRWGKNKTITQITTIITGLVFLVARDWLRFFDLWERVVVRQWQVEWVFTLILHVMMFFCVVLTVWSGARYMWANRDLFTEM